MDIFNLPKDTWAEIWSYLTGEEIVRFGMVCKRAQSCSWPAVQTLGIGHAYFLDYVLSRDLSNIRELEISIINEKRKFEIDPQRVVATLAKFPKLAEATNLRSLVITVSIDDELPEMEVVADTLVQLTNLENLGIAFNHPRSKYDVGTAFKNHHKLTKLDLMTDKYWLGVDHLTQLKALSIAEFDFKRIDQGLAEITAMTQLQELEIGDLGRVKKEKMTAFSNMRNLEKVVMVDPRSINFLADLPKLSSVALSFGYQGDLEEEFKFIGQLTNLTYLLMDTWNSAYLDVDQWTNLTNLKSLSLGGQINEADFSKFKHMTYLVVLPRRSSFELTNLPPNLIHLGLSTSKFNEVICEYPSLRVLEVESFKKNEVQNLSKLTNLESIWADKMTKEQLAALRVASPHLKFLRVMKLESDTVPELLQFTQLCAFGYKELDGDEAREELNLKAPFVLLNKEFRLDN